MSLNNSSENQNQQKLGKVNPLVKFSVTRYVFAVAVFLGIFAFGLVSTFVLGVDLMPNVSMPVVMITTTYTGATPDVVDELVTKVLEDQITTISGISDINSTSTSGTSRIIVYFNSNVNKDTAANQVSAACNAAMKKLPTAITAAPSVKTFDSTSTPVVQFGVWADGDAMGGVNDYLDNSLIPQLERVKGVASVTTDGEPTREIMVYIIPSKLASYNLNTSSIVTCLEGEAVNAPIGSFNVGKSSLSFQVNTIPASTDQISNFLVDSARGIKISDVARVQEVLKSTEYTRINGRPVVLLSILKQQNDNSVAIADGVKASLSKTKFPAGYHYYVSNDTTGPIRASISQAISELINTTLVVALIVLLFLGRINTAFSVILAIPIALAAGPILYNLGGFSFNLVSILALITAIGIVVDDSIVMSENVERYKDKGLSLKDAVLAGASEIFSAVVAASLSLLSVLIPVSFMGGMIGAYIMQFSLGLSAAVLLSLFEALLFLTVRLAYTPEGKDRNWKDFTHGFARLPQALAWGFKNWRKPIGIVAFIVIFGLVLLSFVIFSVSFNFIQIYWYFSLIAVLLFPVELGIVNFLLEIIYSFAQSLTNILHGATEVVVSFLRDLYVKSLKGVFRFSGWILLVMLAVFIGTMVFLMPKIPFNFMPQSDGGTLTVGFRLPTGVSIDTTNGVAARIEKFLATQKEVQTVQTVVNSDGSSASITVSLIPVEQRKSVFVMAPELRKKIIPLLRDWPSARIYVATGTYGSRGGGFGGGTLQMTVVSPNFEVLKRDIEKIRNVVETNRYVVDATTGLDDLKITNYFVPDSAAMAGTGIKVSDISTYLETYITGTQANYFDRDGSSYYIYAQIDPFYITDSQALLNIPIYSSTLATNLTIGRLGHLEMRAAPQTISRYNRLYSTTVNMDLTADAPPVLPLQNSIEKLLIEKGLLVDNGITISQGSQYSATALASQMGTSGPLMFLIALFLAYLVMGSQFNSWKYPVYLLLPVPLALMGALWFVFFIGGGLDLFALLGMLMLIGLSAKNAILYLEFVMDRIKRMPLKDALTESAGLRFRPIVMTTLTVLVISFPLVFSNGQGAEFGQKLGIVMFGGIVCSALLTFFIVPAAFYRFERNKKNLEENSLQEAEMDSKVDNETTDAW